jgi:hypothetical protein
MYQPLKGAAVYFTPPTSKSTSDTAGSAYHFKPRFTNHGCSGCEIGTSRTIRLGTSIHLGARPGSCTMSGSKSNRVLGPPFHPNLNACSVSSTFIGSPVTAPPIDR